MADEAKTEESAKPKKAPRAAKAKLVTLVFKRNVDFEGAISGRMHSFVRGDEKEFAEGEVAHLFTKDGVSKFCVKK